MAAKGFYQCQYWENYAWYNHCFYIIRHLHQLYANIATKNTASIALFTKFGFEKIGVKKDWTLVNGIFKDEALYQLVNQSI